MSISLKKVIFSITESCNFNCKYCFPSHGINRNHLRYGNMLKIIEALKTSGCHEITFIGGEPTLCPELARLTKFAKSCGLITKIVTNGTGLTESFLTEMRGQLDYITISVDSLDEEVLKCIGRQCHNTTINSDFYYNVVKDIRNFGYNLKINTLVSSKNLKENLVPFINYAAPQKWKLFQMVSVAGKSPEFTVSDSDFDAFCEFHKKHTDPLTRILVAPTEFIKGSCTMIAPNGRFFDITNGTYNYSDSILEVGVEQALAQIVVDEEKFRSKMTF